MTFNIDELLQKISDELVDYINNKKYVYKTCDDFIVVLEKLKDTITNENRSNVSQISDNKLYAKYRANKLLVKKIINKYELTNCEKVMSNGYKIKTEYKINETVYPNKFDNDLENVCSSGIHYFLNLKSAFYYGIVMNNMNGKYLSWYDDGQIKIKCNYVDGKLNGEHLRWYENGQMYEKCNYINGKIHGEYLKWYKNGQMCGKCNYINGKIHGEYLSWYENGQMEIKCNCVDGYKYYEDNYLEFYENGEIKIKCLNGEYLKWYDDGIKLAKCKFNNGHLCGEYVEWYKNGDTKLKCNYVDGELNGEYVRWYENGQMYEKCNYIDGEINGEYWKWNENGQMVYHRYYDHQNRYFITALGGGGGRL